ncbi:hydrogenase maturation protease [Lutibacter sp. TH_r2]|uniref:hydrogenase maturation protease n=1 Tax=Lutibacter sp. TH_r2 TaxID=3082083 RepID=UPI0029531227|nr:hydrogenase maturation protease [Lutibacter sp. TH_r2]MDV7188235.1 hydrogenase maturation protease [Lutibacter sp. TH_r2]
MKKLDKTLIIGIGNNTRKDDGLGWCFLDILEEKGYNSDNLLCKYQLMVEDAEIIADYNTVIFIDACKNQLKNGFLIEEIFPAEQVTFSTHAVPPNQILNLCETIYNKTPKAYVIKIEGFKWNIEIGLSEQATQNLNNALNHFEQYFFSELVN